MFDLSIYLSLALLFGIAAQFRSMGGYEFLRWIISVLEKRLGILYAVALLTVLFSPFILNDVVVLVLTPVLVKYAKQFSVDITPLLVAEITFTNIASSLTPLGNPQNILLWGTSGISARQFVAGTWLPLTLSGLFAAFSLLALRSKAGEIREGNAPSASRLPVVYLCVVALIVFSLDLVGVSNVLALGLAFVFGFVFTFNSLRNFVREFDFKSLLILYFLVGSVTLIAALIQPILEPYVTPAALGLQPYSALFVLFVSNMISNVPATQLLLSVSHVPPHIAPQIAVEAGLAGNLDPIASFANILALLIVKRSGLSIRKAVILQLVIGAISFLPAII
jgi:Na+/H+ antiporter NhaD/arsenite permease-like protein